MIAGLITRACEFIAARRPYRTFDTKGSAYLTKFDLVRFGALHLCLHRFHRSDMDRELHNHPWRWAVSLILVGGYLEHFLGTDKMVWSRRRAPGAVNILSNETYHRVDLLDAEAGAWTLFLTGPKVQSWGFYDPSTKVFTPWREFIRARDRGAS